MRASLRRRPNPALTLVQLRTQPRETLEQSSIHRSCLAIRHPPPNILPHRTKSFRTPKQLAAAALRAALKLGHGKASGPGLRQEPLKLPEHLEPAGRPGRPEPRSAWTVSTILIDDGTPTFEGRARAATEARAPRLRPAQAATRRRRLHLRGQPHRALHLMRAPQLPLPRPRTAARTLLAADLESGSKPAKRSPAGCRPKRRSSTTNGSQTAAS